MRDNQHDNDRGVTADRFKALTDAALGKYNGPDTPITRKGSLNSPGSEKFSGQWNGGSSDVGASDSAESQGADSSVQPNARK